MNISRKRISINMIGTIVSYIVTVLMAFILTPYLINSLGVEEFSFYPLTNNFIVFLSLLTLALNSMGSRFVTFELVNNNNRKANAYYNSLFFSNVIMCILLIIPISLFIIFIDEILNIPETIILKVQILMTFIFGSLIVNTMFSVFGISFFSKNRLELKSYLEILTSIFRVILLVVMFQVFPPSIVLVGIVIFILSILSSTIQLFITKKIAPELTINKKHFELKLVKSLFASGVWNSINQAGSLLLYSSDILLANVLFGAALSGQLAVVHTIPNFINGIISVISAVFLPIFTAYFAKNNIKQLVSKVKDAQKIIALITIVPIAVFMVIGESFFELWLPNSDAAFLQKMSVISCIHLILVTTVWPISNLNLTLNKLKMPSIIFICFGITNLVVIVIGSKIFESNVFIIPITTMILSIIWFGFFIPLYSARILQISLFTYYDVIIKASLSFLIIYTVLRYVNNYLDVSSWIELCILVILFSIIGYVINYLILYGFKKFNRRKTI